MGKKRWNFVCHVLSHCAACNSPRKSSPIGQNKEVNARSKSNTALSTLHIFRNSVEFIRSRSAYGLDQHIIRAHQQIGFDSIYVVTPARCGHLAVSIDALLARKPFRYHAYEKQVPFKIAEKRQVTVRSYYSVSNQTVVFSSCIKNRDESHVPTVATSSVESGGPNDAPERET